MHELAQFSAAGLDRPYGGAAFKRRGAVELPGVTCRWYLECFARAPDYWRGFLQSGGHLYLPCGWYSPAGGICLRDSLLLC